MCGNLVWVWETTCLKGDFIKRRRRMREGGLGFVVGWGSQGKMEVGLA